MKLVDLIQVRRVIGTHTKEQLPSGLAYKLMKFMKASENEDVFFTSEMNRIIDTYCERDELGTRKMEADRVFIQSDYIDECNAKIKNLNETEVDKPAMKFTVNELEPIKFSISEMEVLDEFIG